MWTEWEGGEGVCTLCIKMHVCVVCVCLCVYMCGSVYVYVCVEVVYA